MDPCSFFGPGRAPIVLRARRSTSKSGDFAVHRHIYLFNAYPDIDLHRGEGECVRERRWEGETVRLGHGRGSDVCLVGHAYATLHHSKTVIMMPAEGVSHITRAAVPRVSPRSPSSRSTLVRTADTEALPVVWLT